MLLNVLSLVLGVSLALNVTLGEYFLFAERAISRWKDEHHRFVGTHSVYE